MHEWKKIVQSFAEFLISNQTRALAFHSVCFITIITCYYYCYFLSWFSFNIRPHTKALTQWLCFICKRIRFIFSALHTKHKRMNLCMDACCIHMCVLQRRNGNSKYRFTQMHRKWHVQTCHTMPTTNASTHTHFKLPHNLLLTLFLLIPNWMSSVVLRSNYHDFLSLSITQMWMIPIYTQMPCRAHYFHRFAMNFSLRSNLFQI